MAKTLMELAEEFKSLGWSVDLISPEDLLPDLSYDKPWSQIKNQYQDALRQYLHDHAAEYQVVEYDHSYLPYPRKEFCSSTLFVARSQLLAHHLLVIKIPSPSFIDLLTIRSWRTWKIKIRSLLKYKTNLKEQHRAVESAHTTVQEADIIVVLNQADRSELVKRGITAEKIYVVPNAIDKGDLPSLQRSSKSLIHSNQVAFIGTFDFRKGALDFPKIVSIIHRQIPDTRFRLIGTKGLYLDKDQVLSFFPRKLKPYIEVIPTFEPEQLSCLLKPCSIGIFPSYLEGFGLGILEMLTASIPVIAYDVPGPSMMLSKEYLVAPGDILSMTQKVIDLLINQDKLEAARKWAKSRSEDFRWNQIAQITSQIYIDNWQKIQAKY
jgi:glycosyltransferase involved in cell wall biosynthesis